MQLRNLKVRNYRSLLSIDFPLDSFSCLIGENNVGKSSLLQAILRFLDGKRLAQTDFYDPSNPVTIEGELSGISIDDLASLAEEHRSRISKNIVNGSIKLMRKYSLDGTSSLREMKLVPKEDRLRKEFVDEFLKGKKGASLKEEASKQYPEIKGSIPSSPTQSEVKELIKQYCNTLAPEQLLETNCDLETGIDNSIKYLLPEPIYIPAVKDLADDMKVKDSATFGKILGLLLNAIEPKLGKAKELFAQLDGMLNRTVSEKGQILDGRLDEIKEVERVIQEHLRENFPQAEVQILIPPPDVKTILSSAKIEIHDGAVIGPVETKGDGLKRSVVFAIFRSFVELARKPEWQKKEGSLVATPPYIFLFEEPELYLHPRGQKSLFDALAFVSRQHQVVVSTHSPLFFSGEATTTFAKLHKLPPTRETSKPFAELLPVSFEKDLSAKEAFQIISYENNNIAFFATDVVLVEGDSDLLAFRHIARKLNPEWDFEKGRVMILRVSGKGNFKRFSEFFARFKIRVHIITDLDAIVREFDKLNIAVSDPLHVERSDLIQQADEFTEAQTPDAARIRTLFGQKTWRERWDECIAILKAHAAGMTAKAGQIRVLELMVEEEQYQPRVQALKLEKQLEDPKRKIIEKLRLHRIHILEKGTIEDYYPESVEGQDKISRAEDFCRKVQTRDDILSHCNKLPAGPTGLVPEFELIFGSIFELLPMRALKEAAG